MPDATPGFSDYKVKDISLAAWGRKEIAMAEDAELKRHLPAVQDYRAQYGI